VRLTSHRRLHNHAELFAIPRLSHRNKMHCFLGCG
jgi:hypothetical protein